MLRINLQEQTIDLLPQCAMLWHEEQTLIITDPHFGKDASFRSNGIPIPAGSVEQDLARLSGLIEQHCPDKLIILGDFFHTKESQDNKTLEALSRWRSMFQQLEVILILGNHDRHSGEPPSSLSIRTEEEGFIRGPFAFCHYPGERNDGYTLAGHLHPAVKLHSRGREKVKAPCFLIRETYAVLPAFGSFTGNAYVEPEASDRLFLIGTDEVIELPTAMLARLRTN